VLSSALAAGLLLLNYSRGLLGAYSFLLMMATAISIFYYLMCALAEVKHSWRTARGWTLVALIGCSYSLFALFGSGLEVAIWGAVLMLVGVPVSYLMGAKPAPSTTLPEA